MSVSKKIKDFYMGFWEKPETFVANIIECFLENRSLRKNIDKSYKLTKEQKAVIDEIEKTCKQTKHDEIYLPAMHVTQLIKISDNDLFYTDHWEIFTNFENDSYYLVFNNYNTNKSFSIDVPQKYNKTFDKILHDTNTNSFM